MQLPYSIPARSYATIKARGVFFNFLWQSAFELRKV